jgi:hypothetical protein
MKAFRHLRPVLFVGSCALALSGASLLAAQDSAPEPGRQPNEKRSPEAQGKRSRDGAGAKARKEDKSDTSGVRDVSDHNGLIRATQSALDHALTLKDQASQEDIKLSKATLTRHTAAIGQALETARLHLSAIESNTPVGDQKVKESCERLREHYDSASEHYRALLEQTNQPQIDKDEIADEAEDLTGALRDAQSEHRKMPGADAVKSPPMPKTD